MAPKIPASWYSHPCITNSPIVPRLVYMTNRIEQTWWYVTPEIRLQKTVASALDSLSLPLGSPTFGEANCYIIRTLGQAMRGSHCEKLKSLANNPWGTKTCSQPLLTELARGPSPVEPSDDCAPADSLPASSWEAMSQNHHLSHSWIPNL